MSPGEKEANAQASRPRLRVLVVDDDPDTVNTLLALLRGENHEARGHRTGQAAVDSLRGGFKPDVVISDIDRGPDQEDGTELGIRLWAAGVKAPLLHYVGQTQPDLPGPVGSMGVTNDDDELVSLVLLATGR